MTIETITHPPFLIRANWTSEQCASNEATWLDLLSHSGSKSLCPPLEGKVNELPKKSRLTSSLKDRIAADVMAAITKGHDTFGKLRKQLEYTDRELKAGIRHARKWQIRATNTGSKYRPNMAQFYTRIENKDGSTRIYTVVRKGA
jgi:hypothetical protein